MKDQDRPQYQSPIPALSLDHSDVGCPIIRPPEVHQVRLKAAAQSPSNPFNSPVSFSTDMSLPPSRRSSLSHALPNARFPFESFSNCRPPSKERSLRRQPPDPEKATHEFYQSRAGSHSPRASQKSTIFYDQADEYDANDPTNHALRILVYLSTANFFLTTLFAFYGILASIVIIISSPVCLCISRQPLNTHFRRFLLPPVHFQLRLIYSYQDEGERQGSSLHPAMLVILYVLAPFLAFGFSIAAWVAAAFWLFAYILGNPNKGQSIEKIEDEKNEGQAVVLGLRGCWEAWLLKALR